MPVNILEQFSDGNYSNLGQHYQSIQIPKYNLKHIMEKVVVIPIYISSGADKNIELNNPNYLKYIKENISRINMNVPTDEYLSKLEEQIKTNNWDFHYTENNCWTNAHRLTPYWYLMFKFKIDCMTPIEVDEAYLRATGKIRPYEELECAYIGMNNILKASYESLYLFDEKKKQWLVGVNAQGANWLVAGEHAVKFVTLDSIIEQRIKNGDHISTKEELIKSTTRYAKEIKERLLYNDRMISQTMQGFKIDKSKEITARMIVMQANKEFKERGNPNSKYVCRENGTFEYWTLIDGKMKMLNYTKKIREVPYLCSGFIGETELLKTKMLVKIYCEHKCIFSDYVEEYCKKNGITDIALKIKVQKMIDERY